MNIIRDFMLSYDSAIFIAGFIALPIIFSSLYDKIIGKVRSQPEKVKTKIQKK